MPFGGNDWLALTQEETLEPGLPICDPHHHFWDGRTERMPYQRYLVHELADDINSGHNVRSTVFIEARSMYRPDGPEQIRPVGEVEFVQGIAAASASGIYGEGRAASAIIGAANLDPGRGGGVGAGRTAGSQPQPVPGHSAPIRDTTLIPRLRVALPRAEWPAPTSVPAPRRWRERAW